MPGRKSVGLAVAAVLVAGLALPACSSVAPTDDGEVLVWGRPDPMSTWEGDRCVTSVPTNLMVFDSLLRITDDGQGVEPGLAESYSYDEESQTYTLALRDSARFSNGNAVTSADVLFSIDEWKAGELSGVYYEQIDQAIAVDDKTVEITMKQPDSFLPALLTWCTSNVYPKDFAGQTPDKFFANPIGAGPFMVTSTEDLGGANERVALTVNPEFWQADALELSGLDIVTVGDENQRVLRFQSGDLDIVEGLGDAELRQLDPASLVYTTPQIWQGLSLNTRSPELASPDVRRAIGQAIDTAAIVAALGEGTIPAQGTLPTNLPDMTGPDSPIQYDPDAAAAALAGKITRPLAFVYNPSDATGTTIANIVQSQLAEAGVTVELVGADAATMRTLGGEGMSWDIATAGASAISPSAFDPVGLQLADHYPRTGANTDILAEQLAVGMASNDPAERQAAIKAIQNDSATQAALIGIADIPQIYAVSPRVKGFAPLPEQLWYPEGVSID